MPWFRYTVILVMQNQRDPRYTLDGMSLPAQNTEPSHRAQQPESLQGQSKENDSVYGPEDDVASIDLDISNDISADGSVAKSKTSSKVGWKHVVLGLIGVIIVAILAIGGAMWYLRGNIIVDNSSDGAASLLGEVDPSMLDGEGDGRVNALLVGVDDGGGGLADTIMLVSFDPVAKDVAMISVPRDLYVDMGEFGSAKINAAHVYGEDSNYDGGGPGLLKDTVSDVLDVPIHYYARIDFGGFEDGINAIDGVVVDVSEPLNDSHFPDDSTGGYDPINVEAGEQLMDGETALKYARSRKTTSDFDRSRRQQEVLVGVRDKVLSSGTMINPTRITRLMGTLGSSFQTDMSVDEMVRLAELAEGVGSDDITQEQLEVDEDNGLLTFINIRGQSAIVPTAGGFHEVQKHVRSLLVDGHIKEEAARVSVLNGTYEPGAAEATAKMLRSYGYNVVNVDNAADQDYERSVIFSYNSDNPYTLRFLENRFNLQAQKGESSQDSDYDIEIVLGNDGSYDATAQ